MGFEPSAVGLYEAAARAEQKYKEQKSDGTGFKNAMSEAASGSGTVSLDAIFEEAAAAYDVPLALLKAVERQRALELQMHMMQGRIFWEGQST